MPNVDHVVLQDFCEEFSQYLKKRFKYKKNFASWNRSGNVGARSKKFDLYVRLFADYSFWPHKTLVIARVAFHDKRKGNGTDFLRHLNEYSMKGGYENIAIESVNACSAAFGSRYGFTPWKSYHYIVSCKALAKNLGGDSRRSV